MAVVGTQREWTVEDVADLFHKLDCLKLRVDIAEDRLNLVPSWVFENPCCPPGETCCDCG